MEKELNNTYTPSGEQARPWIRYWARLIDIFVYAILQVIILILILTILKKLEIEINIAFLDEIPDLIFNIVIGFLYIFVEPIFFTIWGTTVGKALLKIRVRHEDGRKLSYKDALQRTFLVLFLGQGIGFPIVAIITHIVAYFRLKNQGITSWDESENYVVTHQTIGKVRATLLIGIPLVLFIFLSIILSPEFA